MSERKRKRRRKLTQEQRAKLPSPQDVKRAFYGKEPAAREYVPILRHSCGPAGVF